jgi:hypothetical protein
LSLRKAETNLTPYDSVLTALQKIGWMIQRQTNSSNVTDHIAVGTRAVPDERGYFGEVGGRFVPETPMLALMTRA